MKGFSNLGQSFSNKPAFNPNMSIIMSDEIYEDEIDQEVCYSTSITSELSTHFVN